MSNEPDDDYDDFDDDESCEPIGSCDECEQDIYEADYFDMDDGSRLCNHCAWIAMGCPSPGDADDDE